MRKIIVEVHGGIHESDALYYVREIVMLGRISGKGDKAQYCYHSSIGDTNIAAFKNEKSDRFVVYKDGEFERKDGGENE